MKYDFFARTDCGLVRANNEDAVSVDAGANLAVLADGMGGYSAGEVASGMATSLIHTEMSAWLAQSDSPPSCHDIRCALEICVDNANQAIYNAALANAEYAGMGTTLVVGMLSGDKLVLGHIGDSRCYRLRAGVLKQITRDHSWLQEQLDAGLLTPQQAAVSPNRNLVTRALGVDPTVSVEINEFKMESHDLLLMCSDGLSEMLRTDEILALVTTNETLEEKTTRLIAAANANGGRDNISVLLVQAGQPERKPGFISRWLRAA
ncbi:MAG: Stp1/IreP family PP2C-type Ser/Thr phosphatase [Burkholderiaceae bacterium]|jgi:protein phosphatase|nr:Stp1/IreP family PP2C-type Ser/Thr phosphatase [Burkholderiaceae bacterium]